MAAVDMGQKYKRIKEIGRGSFGKAYLVKNTEVKNSDGQDTLNVVKQMDLKSMDEKDRNSAYKEATVMRRMSHPNIVKFHDVFSTKKGRLCIVMEYADGGDIAKMMGQLKGQLLSEARVLEWFVQVCFAMQYVHGLKVLHRDLKTQNIFLMGTGQVKLGDFGVARVLECTREDANTWVGTPYYLSPEILQERPYSFKTDVWSCGVVLYELVTLTRPFSGSSIISLAGNIIKGGYPEPDARYSKECCELMRSMMQKSDRQRPAFKDVLKLPFLNDSMAEANDKHGLELDLSEFARPDTRSFAEVWAEAKDIGCETPPQAPSEFSESEGEAPPEDDLLARSLSKTLKLPTGSLDASGLSSGIGAKVLALRTFLKEQLSEKEEEFQKAYELVKSSAGVSADDLTTQLQQVIGDTKAIALLKIFQLLCFLESIADADSDVAPAEDPLSAAELKIVEAFKKWDRNGDGVISPGELSSVLEKLGIVGADISSIFRSADLNKDNRISYKEFVRWVFASDAPMQVKNELDVSILAVAAEAEAPRDPGGDGAVDSKDQSESKAATAIQARVRGKQARKEVEEKKQVAEAKAEAKV